MIGDQSHCDKTQWVARCQINLIGVNFHIQKSLETLDKNSANKIWSKKDNGMENALHHAN